MNNVKIDKKDELVMKLLHYFVTKENYKPIFFKDAINEIWLENLNAPYKIVRININYLHNTTQCKQDILKAEFIMKKIKKKTLSFKMNMLNLLIDVNEGVEELNSSNVETKIVKKLNDLKKDKDIKSTYPNIEMISNKKADLNEIIKLSEDLNKKNIEDEKKAARFFVKKPTIITDIIIGINVILYILLYIFGDGPTVNTLLAFGANYAPLVKSGEVYRLITSAFLHAGIFHLLFNMYALKIVGSEIERYFGKFKYILIYLGSAICGSIMSCALTDSVSVGASGAIFGLFGSLVYFGYFYRLALPGFLKNQIIPLIVLNLIISLTVPGIDLYAHLGGLIGGFLVSMAVGIKDKTNKRDKINGIIMSLIFIGFLLYLLFVMK